MRCGLGYIIERLDPDDLALLDQWLDMDSGKSNRWIADVLKADGHTTSLHRPPSHQVVERHRRSRCGCT